MDSELRRLVRHEIRQYLNVILNCNVGESTTEDQQIDQVYPGAPMLDKRPVVHPYGLVSRAPQGKLGVTARVGEHVGARMIIGHRDVNRSKIALEEGETCLYAEEGKKMFMRKDKVQIGSESADNPMVLGNEIKELLGEILNILKQGNMCLTTGPGSPTAPNPSVTPILIQLEQKYLTNDSTNILSQTVFNEGK